MKQSKKLRAFLLAIFNGVFLVVIIISIAFANNNSNKRNFQQNVGAIQTLNESQKNALEPFLKRQIQTADNLVTFIDNYTIDDAIDFVSMYYKYSHLEFHFINVDDLSLASNRYSYRIVPGENPIIVKPEDTNDKRYYNTELFNNMFRDISYQMPSLTKKNSKLCYDFNNPYNNCRSIAVYNKITLIENGVEKHFLMLQVNSRTVIEEILSLEKTSYKNSINIIVDDKGNYLFKSSDNLSGYDIFSYISFYNNGLDLSNDVDFIEGNAYHEIIGPKKEKCIITSERIDLENDTKIYIMKVTPIQLFEKIVNSNALYFVVITLIVLMVVVDFIFLSLTNKKLKISYKNEMELNDKLTIASKAKTDFLSSMSHDIRTPMNAIIGMNNIAKKRLEHNDISSALYSLKKIDQASNHLLTLINDILDISKIEEGKISLNPATFDMSETIDSIVNVIKVDIALKTQDLRVHVKNFNHNFIFADELRIKQVWINILSNAVKYTPSSGKIEVDISQEEISNDKVRVIFSVKDNGIGMSEEFQKQIFDKFTRAIDSRINKVQGSGLGMTITKKMVDLMGGKIEVYSKLNEGSTFIVTLDLDISKEIIEEKTTFDGLTSLIIDDDKILLETSKMSLEEIGIKTDIADNGFDGVKLALEKHNLNLDYNIVFVDWKMPGLSGLSTIKKLKENLKEDIPIVIVTSYDYSEIEYEAKEIGVVGFISKPIFKSNLIKEINRVIYKHEAKQEEVKNDLSSLKVLYAEDNDFNFEILQELLEDEGVIIERAINGKVAVDMVKDNCKYDVIFMDIQMPILNGVEACKMIRSLNINIPIFAVTADAFSEDVDKCLKAGMDGHVSKPIDINKINEILNKIIENKN